MRIRMNREDHNLSDSLKVVRFPGEDTLPHEMQFGLHWESSLKGIANQAVAFSMEEAKALVAYLTPIVEAE